MEAFKYLQNKSRAILGSTIAAIVALGTLYSAGLIGVVNIFEVPINTSSDLSAESFLTNNLASILTPIMSVYHVFLYFFLIIVLIQFYTRIIGVYRHTRLNPLIDRNDREIVIVRTGKVVDRTREEVLAENDQILSNIYKEFQSSGLLFVFIFFTAMLLLFNAHMIPIDSSIELIIFTLIYVFLSILIIEKSYEVYETIDGGMINAYRTYVDIWNEAFITSSDINKELTRRAFMLIISLHMLCSGLLLLSVLINGGHSVLELITTF